MPFVKRGGQKTYRHSMRSKTMYGRKLNPKQKKEVKTIIARRQELKYFHYVQAATAVSTTADVSGSPFDIVQGDQDQERDGDRLQWCGTLEFNLQVVSGQTAGTSDLYNNVRVMLFQWHPTSTSAPSPVASDVLSQGPSGNPDIYSVYNHDTRQNYKILFDRVYRVTLNTNGTIADNSNSTTGIRRLRISMKKARKDVQYVGNGLQGTNRIFLLTVSDSALATHPTLAFASKIFFRDS